MGYPWTANDILTAADLNAAISTGVISTGLAAWSTWTPTWTGFTVGNGTDDSTYFKAGRLVVASFRFTMGSTSAVGTTPTGSLPVTAAYSSDAAALLYMRDVSASAEYTGIMRMAGTTSFYLMRLIEARTFLTSTTPFTWATGDLLKGTIVYQSAS